MICFKMNFREEDQPNILTVSKAEIKERSRCFTTGPASCLCFSFSPRSCRVTARWSGWPSRGGRQAGPPLGAVAPSAPPGPVAHIQLPRKVRKGAAGALGSRTGCCRLTPQARISGVKVGPYVRFVKTTIKSVL